MNPQQNQIAAMIGLTSLGQASRVMLTIGSSIILGRLLAPEDFGLIAAIAPLTAFLLLIQDLGFTHAIVQREKIEHSQVNALFWLALGVSAVLAVVLALSAPFVASVLMEPRLVDLITASAPLLIVGAFTAQHVALLNRELRFKALIATDIASQIGGIVAAIAVAYATASYWALFFAQVTTAVIALFTASSLSRWQPGRPAFDPGVRQMTRFGAGLSVFNLLNFFSRNADNLLIAKVNGIAPLGLYDRAYKLMLFPLSQANAPLGRVLVPLLSRLQRDPERYRSTYLNSISYLLTLTQPPVLCAVIFAGPVVALLLGEQWSGAAPIFAWLGLAAVHQLFTNTLGWLFISQGRGKDFALLGVFGSTTTVASFVAGLPWGPSGVAAAYAITDYLIRLPVTWWMAGRRGHVHWRDICAATAPHAVASLAATALLASLRATWPLAEGFHLAAAALASYAIYLLALSFFPDKRALMVIAFHTLRHHLDSLRGKP